MHLFSIQYTQAFCYCSLTWSGMTSSLHGLMVANCIQSQCEDVIGSTFCPGWWEVMRRQNKTRLQQKTHGALWICFRNVQRWEGKGDRPEWGDKNENRVSGEFWVQSEAELNIGCLGWTNSNNPVVKLKNSLRFLSEHTSILRLSI